MRSMSVDVGGANWRRRPAGNSGCQMHRLHDTAPVHTAADSPPHHGGVARVGVPWVRASVPRRPATAVESKSLRVPRRRVSSSQVRGHARKSARVPLSAPLSDYIRTDGACRATTSGSGLESAGFSTRARRRRPSNNGGEAAAGGQGRDRSWVDAVVVCGIAEAGFFKKPVRRTAPLDVTAAVFENSPAESPHGLGRPQRSRFSRPFPSLYARLHANTPVFNAPPPKDRCFTSFIWLAPGTGTVSGTQTDLAST